MLSGAVADAAPAPSGSASGQPAVLAPFAELADGTTGAPLWTRAAQTRAPMGSIAKVMTALVVLQSGDIDRPVTVPQSVIPYDNAAGASTAGLVPGEVLTARQLLYAMLIPSGCDAAYSLAASYGPGVDAFIGKMNATAQQLGLADTHFTDVSGLPYPTGNSTYSTPADLVRLGMAAMAIPAFRDIVSLPIYHVDAGPGHRDHTWQNSDALLTSYPGAIGIKTGSTNAAGYCLLFEAVRGGHTLIGAVLDSSAVSGAAATDDARQLLDWGFGGPFGLLGYL
ncbi:D-alanyl-D-alanine carboxypeptidase [Antrihabitans cavernicola]|uniref:D-alanyl-D-alanine carboxypeptidase n=2 Tax=Antrihabitans cavernicola TaxID=2495913 RepID=A0A5A7S526_9NOCA|nr:D-alanyl-D-alanine carboxypeptidase [Spelaeibacter cavernicola]